jgi:hypothetical protein
MQTGVNMKFPNFKMTKSFSARAFVLLAGLFLMASASFGQKAWWTQTPELIPQAVGLNIEQCGNGPITAPVTCDTTGANRGYIRGNLVASKSHYSEGDFVPIRVIFEGIPTGQSYTVTVGYDFTKGGKYATDYLGDFDYTESIDNDPCVGVTGCLLASRMDFPVQPDPQVAAGFPGPGGHPITQIGGSISCFGCTITAVSVPTVVADTTGDSSKFVTITFTANQANIVIAYGSHISTRSDWGLSNSAINISGSPYHNFVSATTVPDTNDGNRDLQLSADAVVFPATVTIVKLVVNPDGTFSNNFESFGFTATNFGTAAFSLMDTDSTQNGGGSFANDDIQTFGAANGTITVTEDPQGSSIYSLQSMSCQVLQGGGATSGTATPGTLASRTVTIVPQEGNDITCWFTNSTLTPTAAPASVSGRVMSSEGMGLRGVYVTITDAQTGQSRTVLTNSFGNYTFNDLEVGGFYMLSVVSKRYQFDTPVRSFSLTSDLVGVDFIASE